MPDKPTWCGFLDEITRQLRELPDRWVDRCTLESILGVGPRRAQQILAPCIDRQIGSAGVADREVLIAHLHRVAGGDAAHYEHQRRRRFAECLEALRRDRSHAVMVEAPVAIASQSFDRLPEGVSVTPGCITVNFTTPTEALEKLLALAMAIGNDHLLFERLATGGK